MHDSEITQLESQAPPGWEPCELAASAVSTTRTKFTQSASAPMFLLVERRTLSSSAVDQLAHRAGRQPSESIYPMTAMATEFVADWAKDAAAAKASESARDPHETLDRLLDAFAMESAVIVPLNRLPEDQTLTLGRSGTADIPVKHSSISKKHVTFSYDDAVQLRIEDMGSKNGTQVNGERLSGGLVLHNGDRLVLGKVGGFTVDAGTLWRVLDRVTA